MKQNTVPMPTPQQQQEAQQMKQMIFDDKMKKAVFPEKFMRDILYEFEKVLKFFSVATSKTSIDNLIMVTSKQTGHNYQEVNFMLNCIMGSPFEKRGHNTLHEIHESLLPLKHAAEEYQGFARKQDAAAEAETKTKLKLLNK